MIVPPHVALQHPLVPAELELPGRLGFDPAIAEEHDPRRQVPHVGRNVRREQQRVAVSLQLPGALEQDARRHRIEIGRRLVEQIHVDRRQKGDGHREALPLSARQVSDTAVRQRGEAARFELAIRRAALEPAQPRHDRQRLADRQRRWKDRFLRQIAEAASRANRIARQVDASDHDAAAVGPRQSDDAAQRRRLAGTVRPEHGDALAGADLEVEAVEHAPAAECLRDASQREHDRPLRSQDGGRVVGPRGEPDPTGRHRGRARARRRRFRLSAAPASARRVATGARAGDRRRRRPPRGR